MKELDLAKQHYSENKAFIDSWSKKKAKALDQHAVEAHDEAFQEFDCLTCANCCKTTGPLFTKSDISRLSKVFNMKEAHFIEEYLKEDEEEDYILKQTPCPFLLDDNRCLVYDQRPKACREFPHTDRKNFYQIRKLTLKNTLICPIAYKVIQRMKIEMNYSK